MDTPAGRIDGGGRNSDGEIRFSVDLSGLGVLAEMEGVSLSLKISMFLPRRFGAGLSESNGRLSGMLPIQFRTLTWSISWFALISACSTSVGGRGETEPASGSEGPGHGSSVGFGSDEFSGKMYAPGATPGAT